MGFRSSERKWGPGREMVILVWLVFALVAILAAIVGLRQKGESAAPGREDVPRSPEFTMTGDFQPVEDLSKSFLTQNTWDYTQIHDPNRPGARREFRKEAHTTLMDDYKAHLYAIRYLRTLRQNGLQPEEGFSLLTGEQYHGMVTAPEQLRGKTVRLRGHFIRHYNNYLVPEEEDTAAAGAEQLCFIYFEDMERQRWPHLQSKRATGQNNRPEPRWYLVVSPNDLRPYMQKEMKLLELRGVFVRRWPPNPDRDYWLPVIAVIKPTVLAVPASGGGRIALKIVLAAVIILIAGLLLMGQRDRVDRSRRLTGIKPQRKTADRGKPGTAAEQAGQNTEAKEAEESGEKTGTSGPDSDKNQDSTEYKKSEEERKDGLKGSEGTSSESRAPNGSEENEDASDDNS